MGPFYFANRNYIHDLLHKTNMVEINFVYMPMVSPLKPTKIESPNFYDPTLYRSLVEALKYAIITRLELNFSVNKLCQLMAHALNTH